MPLHLPTATRWARMILDNVHREYPNHLVYAVASDGEVRPPRELTPAFYGSFDWHSCVHSHWSLVRLRRTFPQAEWVAEVDRAVSQSLTPENVEAEVQFQFPTYRSGFEVPYGQAWLLQLAAELREYHEEPYATWARTLEPLETLAVEKMTRWLSRVARPIRTGEHNQSAFSMGLCLAYARIVEDEAFETLLVDRAETWYRQDKNVPLHYEPSGHDFLSPALAEADLMGRILLPPDYAAWLAEFLPVLDCLPSLDGGEGDWLTPVVSPDSADGKLSHWNGLNLSRAWMLLGMASALRREDPRVAVLELAADAHAIAGCSSVTSEHYAGSHWLGSFAIYLLTDRGLRPTFDE